MKRVVVGIPEEMLAVLDRYAEDSQSRSAIIREACSLLIEKKSLYMKQCMINGYKEMAEINQIMAEEMACDFDCIPREIFYLGGRNR